MQPPQPGYTPQPGFPPQPGYIPQPGFSPQPGYPQQSGYGQPGYPPPTGPGADATQVIRWLVIGAIGLLGLLATLLTGTLEINILTAVSKVTDACERVGGSYAAICQNAVHSTTALACYLLLIILGSLAVIAGAVTLALRQSFAHFLVLGGGAVMSLFALIATAQYSFSARIGYDLVVGLLLAGAGGAMCVPAVRAALGFAVPPGLGLQPGLYPGQPQYGQQAPGQYGPPAQGWQQPPRW